MLCDQALALVPPHEAEWRDDLVLRKATLLADRADYREVLSLLSPLLGALSGERKVSALLICARAAFWLTDNPMARDYCEQATALAEILGDRASVGAALAVRLLTTSADGDLHEGLAIADKALSLFEGADTSGAVGDHIVEYSALVLSHLGLHHYWLAHHAEGAEACRRSYEIGLAQHHVETALASGAQYGMALAGLGRYEDAFRVLGDVIANGDEVELLPRLTGRAVAMWAGALRELQDLDGARRMNEKAAEMGRRSAFPNTQVQSATDLLLIDLLAGEVGSVQTQLPIVLAQAEALRGWHQWLLAGRLADVTARLHLATGDHAAAAEAAEASIRQAGAVGRVKYESSGRMVLAEALAGLGRLDEARGHAEEAHRVAAAIEHLPTMWETADVVSRLAEAVGDDDAAASAGQAAADALTRCADGLHDERRSAFLAAPGSQELLRRSSS